MKLIQLVFAILIMSCSNPELPDNKTINTQASSKPESKKNDKPALKSITKKKEVNTKSPKALLDSILSKSSPNTTSSFDIRKLQTDDFSNMLLLDKALYNVVFSKQKGYMSNSYFVYAHLANNKDYYSFITYHKNYEGEDYRVDYIDLININEKGEQLNKTRLAAIDNAFIIYEVSSTLNEDILVIQEKVSSEPNMDTDIDTLHFSTYTLKLFGNHPIDTLDVKKSFKLIGQ